MSQWEYKVVHFRADKWTATGLPQDVGQKFDEYGRDGWELVSTEALVRPGYFFSGASTVGIVACFKRPSAS